MNKKPRSLSSDPIDASRLMAFLDATEDAVIETHPDGEITGWNTAACRMFGATADEMIGQTVLKLFPENCGHDHQALLARLLEGESTPSVESCCHSRDGLLFEVSIRSCAVFTSDGAVAGAVSIIRDISQMKLQQRELDRLGRLYAALSHIKQAIARSQSHDELLSEVCRILVEEAGFCTAWVGMHDDTTSQIVPAACFGAASDFVRDLRIYTDDRPEGQGPAGQAFRSRQPVICEDVASDPTAMHWRVGAAQFGVRSVADFPIMANGDCIGLLLVYSRERNYFQEREISLLFETAGEIAFALDALEREAARHAAEALAVSEQAFGEAMINAMPGIVYFYDTEGRIVRWNQNFEEVSGYSGEEIAQMHPVAFFPEAERALIAERIAAVFDAGDASVEANFLTRKGDRIPHYFTGRRVEMGGREYLVGVGVDLTEKQNAETAQQISEQRYRTLFEYAPDGILIGGRDTFLDANESICRMLGLSREQVVGVSAADIVAESELAKLAVGFREFNADNRYHGRSQLRRADGSVFPAEVIAARLPDGDIIAMARDVSDQEAAAEALRDLNRTLEARVESRTSELAMALQRAETADRLKSSFLATMSHELRTPLNSIIGFTGILLQELAGPLNTEQEKQLAMVRGSARHLLDLINDVLDISKIEAGQLKVMHEAFDVVESIERAVTFIAPQAEKKGLALNVRTGDIPAQITADRRRVEQILINLLSNAVKFTDSGAVTLDVSVEPECFAGDGMIAGLRFTVTDTGIGIRPEDLDSLFQPFRQLDDGLSRQHEGTGLGLAICRRLAGLMNGRINASSTEGEGSAFTLRLPMQEL